MTSRDGLLSLFAGLPLDLERILFSRVVWRVGFSIGVSKISHSGVLGLSGGRLGVGGVVHHRSESVAPLCNYVTQWSTNFREKKDQFRKISAKRINRKNGHGRCGYGDTAGGSFCESSCHVLVVYVNSDTKSLLKFSQKAYNYSTGSIYSATDTVKSSISSSQE